MQSDILEERYAIEFCFKLGKNDAKDDHIISECSKLVQKEYTTKHDWMGKVINWELCKKLKFDHTNK